MKRLNQMQRDRLVEIMLAKPKDVEQRAETSKRCARCQKPRLDYHGDAPKCFNLFGAENWNCATLNAIREICHEGQDLPPGVDYQYCEDQKYATINIDHCETRDGDRIGLALWVSWYKNRGKTDALWILSEDKPPHIPTEDELNIIIAAYARRN